MTTSDEGLVIFEKEELNFISKKFRLSLVLVDSAGFYNIGATDEEMLLSSFADRFYKVVNFLQQNYSVYGRVITHHDVTYYTFEVYN